MRRGPLGFWERLAVAIIKPPSTLLTRRQWLGRNHLPQTGPVIVAVNHISYLDPFPLAHFLYDSGRIPRFMAKESVFSLPVGGRIVAGAGQIPVHRYTEHADDALASATAALRRGECVVIYPEGTVTKDPAGWPMRARTGVARLALLTGAPVIPLAQWGARDILGPDKKLRLVPRRTVRFLAGPPVDFSSFDGRESSGRVLRDMTAAVMTEIRRQVGVLRGETPPAEIYDPRRLTPVIDVSERRSA